MALSARRLPSLLRVPASPVPRSQRYYEGATTSHLRISGHLLVRFHCPRDPPSSCSLARSRKSGGPLAGQGFVGAGSPNLQRSLVDANGISQVSRRSFPCLCSAPRPRSNRCALAMTVTSVLPPAYLTVRASDVGYFGAHSRSFGTRCPTLRVSCCHSRARLASGWLAFAGRESNPLDHCERFQIT